MLTTCRSHEDYQLFLKTQLTPLYKADTKRLLSFSNSSTALWVLNLDPAIPYLCEHYSSIGRPAEFDPVDLLRSLILMAKEHIFGITKWVQSLRNDRVLAVLSGFSPHMTPSVGTFYNFLTRFWLEFCNDPRERRLRLRPARRKLRKKKSDNLKKGDKMPNKRPYVVSRLVKQIVKGRRLLKRPERLMQFIFARCIVDNSITMGLIPTQPSADPTI